MMKRVIALLLCMLMVLPVLASCGSGINEDNKGAHVTMYLTDIVYDLDPVYAYNNESTLKLAGLLFDNLFVLNEDGKVKKSLAKDYKIVEDEKTDEYKMVVTLKDTTWSDGVNVSADDVVYAWKRILDVANSFDAASLLFDVKNARLAKEGECSIDDVGIYADGKVLTIQFEGPIDYDQFLIKMTSLALAPLREDIVKKTDDWAKKPATIVTSGPFRLREVCYDPGKEYMLLERNVYYCRDIIEDRLDKSVTPYRLIVDYTKSAEEIMNAWENGEIFYVGNIPLSYRKDYASAVEKTTKDALSTHTYFLNENAKINGVNLFAIDGVREAMMKAIDRDAIAEAIVFAEAATGLVSSGVFEAGNRKKSFREVGGVLVNTTADEDAKDILNDALSDINKKASDFSFSISVAAYDEVHIAIAEMVAGYWSDLGFNVSVKKVKQIVNDDEYVYSLDTSKNNEKYIPDDIMDDIWAEDLRSGNYEVIALDYTAFSADAFSVLSQFAKGFTGRASVVPNSIDYSTPVHLTGMDNEEFNDKIEAAFEEKDVEAQAALLHEAEEILIEDAHIIPIIFNQNATLISKDLSKIKFTYYGVGIFNKMKQKNWKDYVPVEEEEQ